MQLFLIILRNPELPVWLTSPGPTHNLLKLVEVGALRETAQPCTQLLYMKLQVRTPHASPPDVLVRTHREAHAAARCCQAPGSHEMDGRLSQLTSLGSEDRLRDLCCHLDHVFPC